MPPDVTYGDLRGKHVLITGGAGGIGSALVSAFANQGCRVTVLDKAPLAQDRPGVRGHLIDLTDFEALVPLLGRIVAEDGPVQVLVNNAGYDPRGSTLSTTVEQWEGLFRLNLGHYFVTARELIPGMIRSGGGSILMTSSVLVRLAWGELTCYTATKAAINGFVAALGREVGRHNIRVNAVAPGWVLTERQLREMLTPERKRKLLEEDQSLPMVLTPEELAGTYLFLASDASRPITRQVITVDAGYTAG